MSALTQNMFHGGREDALDPLPITPPYYPGVRKRERSKGPALDRFKMSGYYYPPNITPQEEEGFNLTQSYQMQPSQSQQVHTGYPAYPAQQFTPSMEQEQLFSSPQQFYQQPQQPQRYQPPFGYQTTQNTSWVAPTVPSNYQYEQQNAIAFPQYSEATNQTPEVATAGPSKALMSVSAGYLSPDEAGQTRISRSTSFASNASSVHSRSRSDVSRSVSPNVNEMAKWGLRNENGTWSCAYPGCSSRSTFNRGCDLRKHYKRHTKSLFCRHEGCPQATEGGFSSKKDRARHEAKHNPNIVCEWEGCDRLFSRVDNMKDHVRRMHKRKVAQ